MMPNRPDETKSDKKPHLLPVDQALAAILALLHQTNTKTKPLDKALGLTLAEDLVAVLTLPPLAVSAMDGYAVRAADVTSFPCKLTRIAESAAGHPWTGKITAGQAVRVFTGAAIPDGADTIVIQEDVDPVAEQDNVEITVRSAEIAGRYIRPAGLDITAGQVILPAGTLLSARAIGLAIAAGLTRASVRLRPRVGVLSTGDELVPPGELPGPGQIISSNASFLANFVRACGAEAVNLGIVRDVPGAMLDAVRHASNLDLVVTTGGASVGTYDHIVSDLGSSGQNALHFWKIAMRPGKPLISGNVDGIPLIGLPGNPVSTAVCALVFLRPSIAHMAGGNASSLQFLMPLAVDLGINDQRQDYIRAQITTKNGVQVIMPAPRQDSSMMSVLAAANALIVRPPYDPARAAGELVSVIPLPDLG
ncbi:molybdopterin molybdotransferase MoeA [Alphaproteobacteria bacterium]|nr:molybdopterin molybdotransferase MoeA [Alphaproteobacteria bacterium]